MVISPFWRLNPDTYVWECTSVCTKLIHGLTQNLLLLICPLSHWSAAWITIMHNATIASCASEVSIFAGKHGTLIKRNILLAVMCVSVQGIWNKKFHITSYITCCTVYQGLYFMTVSLLLYDLVMVSLRSISVTIQIVSRCSYAVKSDGHQYKYYSHTNTLRRETVTTLYSRATENRFFVGSDWLLVCKTNWICIKHIFFSVRKNTLCRLYTGPITWISQVSNR